MKRFQQNSFSFIVLLLIWDYLSEQQSKRIPSSSALDKIVHNLTSTSKIKQQLDEKKETGQDSTVI